MSVLTKTAKPIFELITGSAESVSELQSYSNLLGQVNVDIPFLIRLIISIYGQVINFIVFPFICSIYVFLKIIKREKISYIYLILSICCLTFFILSILMFFINGSFGFARNLNPH